MTALPDDTDALAARIRDGDRAAFEALFRALHAPLVRYAHTLADEGAEDAVQDAFLGLWRRRTRIDPGRSVRSLLYTTVRNALFNQHRDARRRTELHDTMDAPDTPPTPHDETSAALLGERLRGWLAELPERQNEAFSLSRFDGLSYAEIADVMACSVKTVENHVGRALRTLRDRLQQDALQP